MLTNRQIEILKYLKNGYNRYEIAEMLFISPETVATHFKNIHNTLEAHTNAQAVAKYMAMRKKAFFRRLLAVCMLVLVIVAELEIKSDFLRMQTGRTGTVKTGCRMIRTRKETAIFLDYAA